MPQTKVNFNVRPINKRVSIIDIEGEFTGLAEGALMDAFNDATADGSHAIILNFSGMEYMNSSGIGLLITLLIRINRAKEKMLVYGLNNHYRQIFMLTRLDEAITICGSEQEAVESVKA